MNTLFIILAVLALVGSVLITLIVLLQNSKGGGLASNFTAGNQTFGVRQTTDILEKITWGLAIFILAVSIAASFAYDKKGNKLSDKATTTATEGVGEVAGDVAAEDLAGGVEEAASLSPTQTE